MLPTSLIIGDEPSSGLIVLITDTENQGVYYWDHSFIFRSLVKKKIRIK